MDSETFDVVDRIPAKHKFFTEDLPQGSAVTMYGVLVGKTTMDV
jgi:altronate hydrolase